MSDEEPTLKVTLGTIYNKLLDVEKKVDPMPAQVSDHEVRIRAIEKYLWIWIGASATLGAAASSVVTALFKP